MKRYFEYKIKKPLTNEERMKEEFILTSEKQARRLGLSKLVIDDDEDEIDDELMKQWSSILYILMFTYFLRRMIKTFIGFSGVN